jgi:hypothetical protein
MKSWFYNKVYNTTCLLFASVFDEMEVVDFDANGHAVGRIPVPIKMTYKEKVVSAIIGGNNVDPYVLRDNENVLPMISIQWTGTRLDKERMKGQREKRNIYIEYIAGNGRPQQKQHMDMQTVPRIMTFEVVVWAKYMDHLAQIAENIDSFIHPEMYLEHYEKGIGIARKLKVTLTNQSQNFNPDVGETDIRSKFLTMAYSFDVECNLYKPELPVGEPIKRVTVRTSATNSNNNFNAGDANVNLAEQIVAETADNTVETSGSSGMGCFYDYDSEIVSHIKKYSDPEHTQIKDQYQNIVTCQTPVDLISPIVTPYPEVVYGELPLTTDTDLVTITDPRIINAPIYVPSVCINAKTVVPTFTVLGYENVIDGSFQVRLSGIPNSNDFTLIWNVTQRYNLNQNDV